MRRSILDSRNDEAIALASGSNTEMLTIAKIRRDGKTQPRAGLNEDAVLDYVAALNEGAKFPAVDVMFDGKDYWLFDGFHRVDAHLRAGRTEIAVKISQGSLEDAQWRSYAANQAHGLRRSNEDKERAVRQALRHPKAPGMSDSALAKHLGVSDKTVTKYRSEMESTSEIPKLTVRTGADGRTRDTSNIGKRPAEPQLRSLSLNETISLVRRVVDAQYPPEKTPTLEFRLVNRLAWLKTHEEPRDYKHELPEGTKLDGQLLINAIVQVRSEIEKTLNAMRQQAAAQPIAQPGSLTPATKRLLTLDESIAVIYRVMERDIPTVANGKTNLDAHARLTWLNKHSQPRDYEQALTDGVKFELSVFCSAWASVAGEQRKAIEDKQRAEEKAAQHAQPSETEEQRSNRIRQELRDEMNDYLKKKFVATAPQPEQSAARPLPGWVAGEPDKLTEPETQPIAIDLRLPSMAIPDKDLFVSQVKRSVGVLSEEGYATVASFLRIVGRYALDAQPDTPSATVDAPQANERSKGERIQGLASILETALMLIGEDYGQLTGYFSHVPAAERMLREMIARLQENLTT